MEPSLTRTLCNGLNSVETRSLDSSFGDSRRSARRRQLSPPRQSTGEACPLAWWWTSCASPSPTCCRNEQGRDQNDSTRRLRPLPRRRFVTRLMISALLVVFVSDWTGTSYLRLASAQQGQDPTTLNGGSILAMAGRDCVAVAVDRRFGSGPALVSVQSGRSLLLPSDRVLVAFTGLQSDVEALQHELLSLVSAKYGTGIAIKSNARSLPSSSTMISPRSVASLTSHVLYGRRRSPYYVEPIVVGLEECEAGDPPAAKVPPSSDSPLDSSSTAERPEAATSDRRYRPYLCSMDVIGATSVAADFACGGAAATSLYGTAEAFWRPNLSRDELLPVIARAFVAALERDCLSGYGALVYVLTADGITEYDISTRND